MYQRLFLYKVQFATLPVGKGRAVLILRYGCSTRRSRARRPHNRGFGDDGYVPMQDPILFDPIQ